MNTPTIVQEIVNCSESPLEKAVKYYTILSVLNNLRLPKKEIQLLAFISVKGSISVGGAKEQFLEIFGSSKASIGNFIFRLSKKGFLYKDGNRIVLHPQLRINFNPNLLLKISLKHDC